MCLPACHAHLIPPKTPLECASNQVYGAISSVHSPAGDPDSSRRSPSQPAIIETLEFPSTKFSRHLEFGYVAIVRPIVNPRIYFFEVAVVVFAFGFEVTGAVVASVGYPPPGVFEHRAGRWGGDVLERALILI
jgi:hypothetical protein